MKHVKLCAKSNHEGKCLKGTKMDKCDYIVCNDNHNLNCKPEHKPDCKCDHECEDCKG